MTGIVEGEWDFYNGIFAVVTTVMFFLALGSFLFFVSWLLSLQWGAP